MNCGPLWRFAALLRSCSSLPVSLEDRTILDRHGFCANSLGANPASWIQKYAADTLRFIEFERTALPCALLRSKGQDKTTYSYLTADMDARSVMEQRIQSLVCAFSLVSRVHDLSKNSGNELLEAPLRPLSFDEAIDRVWKYLIPIPECLSRYILDPASKANQKMKFTDKRRVQKSVDDIQSILIDGKPRKFSGLQSAILGIRQKIVEIEDLSIPTARLKLLADVLGLWAHTTNYSAAKKNKVTQSPPISVLAKELGTNIPSSILLGISGPNFDPSTVSPRNPIENARTDRNSSPTTHESTEDDCNGSSVAHSPGVASMTSDGSTIDENATSVAELSTAINRVLKPCDTVYTDSKAYGPYFIFWQLMSWFNAGSDKREEAPDLFGCVVLPPPESCFGRSKADYKEDRRRLLMTLLGDEKKQMLSWCEPLKECFDNSCLLNLSSQNTDLLFGSPMLDVALGNADAIRKVREELFGDVGDKFWAESDHTQFDSILPPEKPTAWVQCDLCSKYVLSVASNL